MPSGYRIIKFIINYWREIPICKIYFRDQHNIYFVSIKVMQCCWTNPLVFNNAIHNVLNVMLFYNVISNDIRFNMNNTYFIRWYFIRLTYSLVVILLDICISCFYLRLIFPLNMNSISISYWDFMRYCFKTAYIKF